MPLLIGISWTYWQYNYLNLNFLTILALALGIISSHLAANTFNDYFDWLNGTDQINQNFILGFSGGSRSIALGLLTAKQTLYLACSYALIAILCGIYLIILKGTTIIWFAIFGGFTAFCYVAPPINLAARYGIGEIAVFLSFGPILVAAIIFVGSGVCDATTFSIGIPLGFLTTAILAINEYPDLAADQLSGKINLAVVLGAKYWPICVGFLIIAAYISIGFALITQLIPSSCIIILLTTPLALKLILIYLKVAQSRDLLKQACAKTVALYLINTGLFFLALVFAIFVTDLG